MVRPNAIKSAYAADTVYHTLVHGNKAKVKGPSLAL